MSVTNSAARTFKELIVLKTPPPSLPMWRRVFLEQAELEASETHPDPGSSLHRADRYHGDWTPKGSSWLPIIYWLKNS